MKVYKSTGDVAAAQAMFDKYSEVPDDGPYPWGKWRDIVMAHKQPRKMFVQGNTVLKGAQSSLCTCPLFFSGFSPVLAKCIFSLN